MPRRFLLLTLERDDLLRDFDLLELLGEERNNPSPSLSLPDELPRGRELRRERRLRSSSPHRRRDLELLFSRYRERRATANARKVATKKRNDSVKKALASNLAMGDSTSPDASFLFDL